LLELIKVFDTPTSPLLTASNIVMPRPRLVHKGSPIVNDVSGNGAADHAHQFGSDNWNSNGGGRHHSNPPPSSTLAGASKSSLTEKYKLQTRLVIGGETASSAQRPSWNDAQHSSSTGVRQFKDDDSLDAMMMEEDEHDDELFHHNPHQMQQQQHQHNSDILHLPPPTNPPPQIYHMPPPSTSPLIVIDGANISYNYSESLNPSLTNHSQQPRQPNPRGITLAIQYFLKNNCRVQAVVPISWYKLKPRPGDHSYPGGRTGRNLNQRQDALMVTDEVEELRQLRQHGFLVPCPPGDDDDAYILALARREEDRQLEHDRHANQQHEYEGMSVDEDNATARSGLPMGGFVLSNDFFKDAIQREHRQQQQYIQTHDHFHQSSLSIHHTSHPNSLKEWLKSHRISYSFANVGVTSNVGGVELDFLPNPRNVLIEAIDAKRRTNYGM
jgi:hypothetical protein